MNGISQGENLFKYSLARQSVALFLCVSLFLSFTPAIGGDNSWTSIQPDGGSASGLAVAGDTVYMKAGSSLFASADGGKSWSLLAEFSSYISTFAIDPDNSEYMLAATGSSGVSRSVDGGATWNKISLADGDTVTSILYSNDAENRIYAASINTGAYTSTDGGVTWAATGTNPGGEFINVLAVDPADSTMVYAGTRTEGIYRTNDGGQSWAWLTQNFKLNSEHDLGEMLVSTITILPGAPAVILAGSFNSPDVARSTDGDATWVNVSEASILPTHSAALRAIAPHPADGGSTWTELNKPMLGVLGPNASAVRVVADGTVLFTGAAGVWRVSADGTTWTESNTGFSNATLNSFALSEDYPGHIIATGRNLLPFLTTDSGENWTITRAPYPDALAVAFAGGNGAWLGQPSGLFHSPDGGATWQRTLPDDMDPWISQVAAGTLHPAKVVAVSEYGTAFRTDDNGNTWNYSSTGLPTSATSPFARDLVIAPSDSDVVYLATSAGLFGSTDGGATWAQVASAGIAPFNTVAVDPSNTDIVFAGSRELGLQKSEDGGETWEDAGLAVVERIAIDPRDGNRLLVAVDGAIYASTNGGASWGKMNANLPNVSAADLHFDPNSENRYVMISNGKLFVYDGELVAADDSDGEDGDGDSGGDAPPPASGNPPPADGGGSGGGSLAWLLLALPFAIRRRTD